MHSFLLPALSACSAAAWYWRDACAVNALSGSQVVTLELQSKPHGKRHPSQLCLCFQTTAKQTVAMVAERERTRQRKLQGGKSGSAKLNSLVFCLWKSEWAAYNVC